MAKRLMKIILLIIFVILILHFFFREYIERRMLYHAVNKIEATPKSIDLEYEDVVLTTKDGVQIAGWFIPAAKPRATILFSHGNGGNISHRLEKISMFNYLNLNVLIFDYRGYGMSKGRPSEEGLYLDEEAMYDYLVNKKGSIPQEIIAYGESLGGAVAIDLAGKHELGGLIIEGTFTSIRDMAKKFFPFVPPSVIKSRYDSLGKIKNISIPKLIFHSVDDDIVPFEQGKKLFDEASGPKEFVQLQGGHNDAFLVSQELFMGKIDSFTGRM
ncbi:MAG: alpha/beta hydrolase [Nitrospirae bacterium]|nr:alpha/beta hydrolase [Nitrospirota bacterium]